MGFSDSKGFGVVAGWITRERTWKFRATRLQGIKVTRRERQVLCVVTGMPRMATSQLKGVWAGVKRQKKRTSPRSKRDHAKYKEGSERKVQRLKGRLLATWLSQVERDSAKSKKDKAYLVLHDAFEEMSISNVHEGGEHTS